MKRKPNPFDMEAVYERLYRMTLGLVLGIVLVLLVWVAGQYSAYFFTP